MPTYAYVIGFLVVAGTALFAVGYQVHLYRTAFRQTAAYRRASRFWAEETRLRRELVAAEGTPPEVPADAIRREVYRKQLQATSIEALDSHPGIGTATLQRLTAAGYQSLADVAGGMGDVAGVGPSRMADVRRAVRAELTRQRQQFDAGATEFAKQAAREVARLTAEHAASAAANAARAAAARRALEALTPYLEAAAPITLAAFFRHDRRSQGKPLPYDPRLDDDLPADKPASPRPSQTPLPIAFRLAELAGEPSPVAPPPPPAPKPPRIPASVKSVATVLLDVAQADGELCAAERAAVRAGLVKFFEHDLVLVRFIDPAIEQLVGTDLDVEAALRFARRLSAAERDLLVRFAGEVAAASGRENSPEFASYERLAESLAAKARKARQPRPALPPVAPPVRTPPPATAVTPAGLRDNGLLDDFFSAPAAEPPVTPAAADDKALRENALLDAAFGS